MSTAAWIVVVIVGAIAIAALIGWYYGRDLVDPYWRKDGEGE